MGIGDPSVKKKLKKDLETGVADYKKKASAYSDLLEKQVEICGDYKTAKKKMVDYITKEIGEERYGGLMSGKVEPTEDDKKLIAQVLKLSDVVMEFSNTGKIVDIDNMDRLVSKARKDMVDASQGVIVTQKALSDYVEQKADLKKKGDKKEYAEWKKALRAKLFPK